MHGCALSSVVPVDWQAPALDRFDALLLGSANAIRCAGDGLRDLSCLPVHAVGQATANAARAEGFHVERLGQGGLQTVLDAVPAPVHYLRLVGNEYVELNWPDGLSFEPLQVYAVEPLALSQEAAQLLQQGAFVLLHSAASTRQFCAECDRLNVDRSAVRLAAMGPRIAAPAGEGWAAIHMPAQPSDTALLSMVRDLCL